MVFAFYGSFVSMRKEEENYEEKNNEETKPIFEVTYPRNA